MVKVPDGLPLELLGPLGCGLQTGAGAVLNSLRVPANASIAILGTGAVGLAAVMAARAAGANPIIGVDLVPKRLALATKLGATHTIDARKEDIRKRIAEITGSGVDYALEITAQPEMLKLAVDILAPCGTAGQIGGGVPGAEAPISMSRLLLGRTVRGIIQGDSIPRIFIPRLIEMYRRGQFPFDRLVRFYDFAQINQAVADAASGERSSRFSCRDTVICAIHETVSLFTRTSSGGVNSGPVRGWVGAQMCAWGPMWRVLRRNRTSSTSSTGIRSERFRFGLSCCAAWCWCSTASTRRSSTTRRRRLRSRCTWRSATSGQFFRRA